MTGSGRATAHRTHALAHALALALALATLLLASLAHAQFGQHLDPPQRGPVPDPDLPPGFYVETAVPGDGFTYPTAIAFTPDGRLLVAEKSGRVWVVLDGVKLATPLVDLRQEVLDHWDRGLLGLAVDPDFATNGHLYFLYTVDRDGSGDYERTDVFARLTRYTVSAADSNLVDPASRHVLIGEDFASGFPACYYSHAPATLRFGSDGTLFVGTGDAANFNNFDSGGQYPDCFGPDRIDPYEDIGAFRSQYLGSLAGKILRIDPATGEGLPSNPHYTGDPTATESKVWASGLRNPFRFSVRPGGSLDPADGDPGSLFMGEVGWGTWEELNIASESGLNFGWPCWEGPYENSGYQNQNPAHSDCSTVGVVTLPTYYFHHTDENFSVPPGLKGSSITGGEFYQGDRYPAEYRGRVFYGDYAWGWMATAAVDSLDQISQHEVFSELIGGVVDIRYDPVSELMYYVNISLGAVMRIRHVDEGAPPVAIASADPSEGYAPLAVQFTGSQSFDPLGGDLSYAWDFGNGDGSDQADPLYTFTEDGVYQVTLAVTNDVELVGTTGLTISVGNTSPVPEILAPALGQPAAVGELVSLLGAATDAEEPADSLAFHWTVSQRHNDHEHPPLFEADGAEASFVVPEHGVLHEVVFLTIRLTVTDSGGLASTVERDLWIEQPAETDVTDLATPIALVTAPTGEGNPDIEVIRDGVLPPAGSSDPLQQYDTSDGQVHAHDWIGYEFPEARLLSRLLFQEGMHFPGGGWFDSLSVEIREEGVWTPVDYVHPIPAYRGDDGVNYDTYVLLFLGRVGDAIRIAGPGGGPEGFISVGELRVFDLPRADFAAAPRVGESPLTVDFTDLTDLEEATGYLWIFGDGGQSTQRHPRHVYTAPGIYDVTLLVESPYGTLSTEKDGYVLVDVIDLQYADFADPGDFALNGAAIAAEAALRLTTDAVNLAGSAIHQQAFPIDAGTSFSAEFDYRIHGQLQDGADGLTFVVQGVGPEALGSFGSGLGYAGIASSLAVEFDIYRNADLDDPDANHVAVDLDGDLSQSLGIVDPGLNLEDSVAHRAWVDYDGEAELLEVFLAKETPRKPDEPDIQLTGIDLHATVGDTAWFGFTAGTGGLTRIHDIERWQLQLVSTGIGAPGGDASIASFSPVSGDPGTRVLISGADLGLATGVSFGGVPAIFSVLSGSQLVADVPLFAVAGPIVLSTPGGPVQSASDFVVTDPDHLGLDFADFATASNLELGGAAALVADHLQLTADQPDQTGAAFYRAAVPLDEWTSFSSVVRFRLQGEGPTGAEGLAFVLQGEAADAMGAGGGGLGYGGLASSLAIELDLATGPGDPAGAHLAVHRAGDPTTPVAAAALPFTVDDGQAHGLWIAYDHTTALLSVAVSEDPAQQPATPLLEVAVADLAELVGPDSWYGFTAATGAELSRAHVIESWQLDLTVDTQTPLPVGEAETVPRRFALQPAYPNPFNPTTTLEFAVPRAGEVRLRIYGVDGRRVRTLVDGEVAPGLRRVIWDGRDDRGRGVSSGIYFARLEGGDTVHTRKMVLVK